MDPLKIVISIDPPLTECVDVSIDNCSSKDPILSDTGACPHPTLLQAKFGKVKTPDEEKIDSNM